MRSYWACYPIFRWMEALILCGGASHLMGLSQLNYSIRSCSCMKMMTYFSLPDFYSSIDFEWFKFSLKLPSKHQINKAILEADFVPQTYFQGLLETITVIAFAIVKIASAIASKVFFLFIS